MFFQFAIVSPAQDSATVEIAAVGDVLLARGVGKKIQRRGAEFPFENVKEILGSADLTFGNLENPLAENCLKAGKKFSFQAKPEYSKILADTGFDVLSLANNHTLDCGQSGLLETIENLKKENLRFVGAGEGEAQIDAPVYVEIKGIRIAFLAFTAISPGKQAEKFPKIALASAEKVKESVALARQNADAVIVSFHWGTEYDSRPNLRQIELANAAIEAGAETVLGHHPHVLQGFQLKEKLNGERRSLVAFSLGNFLFDSPIKLIKKTAESVILKIRFNKKGLVSAEVVPVSVENYRPVVAGAEKKQIIFNHLSQLSGEWNTALDQGRVTTKYYAKKAN